MNSSSRYFIALAASGAITMSCVAQQVVNIAPSGNQMVLFWSTSATNYTLQSATNLASPDWVTADDAILVNAVTVTNASSARFFRLVRAVDARSGMALIPAGTFTMGDTLDNDFDAYPTSVSVSDVYMDTNLVSYGQWLSVYGFATNHGYDFVHSGSGKAVNNPVQTVDWYDAVKWCNARSQREGLAPVYFTDAALSQVYTNGEPAVAYVNWGGAGYRLPTEAEWEKAARGGNDGQRFPWGNTISQSLANYVGDTTAYSYDMGPNGYNPIGSIGGTSPATSPVGSFPPNGYGLYDMAGNVAEWCWDWYGTPYGGGIDPRGPATGVVRVVRGGYCSGSPFFARCCFRGGVNSPVGTHDVLGFRCARSR